jgi:hypothetical protein
MNEPDWVCGCVQSQSMQSTEGAGRMYTGLTGCEIGYSTRVQRGLVFSVQSLNSEHAVALAIMHAHFI